MKHFLVCALEPSANLHLREVLKLYKKEYGEFELLGIFDGALCEELGLKTRPLYDSSEFSAMGFVEVLPLIFKAKKAIKALVKLVLENENLANSALNSTAQSALNSASSNLNSSLSSANSASSFALNSASSTANSVLNSTNLENETSQKESKNFAKIPINCVLCIDSPAFNIAFAKALKKAGSKTKRIYYILPQVWAWKKGRVSVIEAHFDLLASILPFDSRFFSKSIYVGHPLLDEIKEFKDKNEQEASAKKQEKIIAFLPGSRRSEIKRLMPVFRELSRKFKQEKILCVPPFNLNKLELYGDTSGFRLESNTPKVLKNADFAFICSGTATLEAALVGVPFVLAYKARGLDICIAKLFVKLKHIGLANIFCDFANKKPLNPEFLQEEVSAENLFKAYENYDYKGFFEGLDFLKEYLKTGSAKNLAKMLNEF